MFCKNCGAQIADQASFCPACGAKTQPVAPVQQPAPKPAAQPAQNLQSVLNVGNDVSKLLNYVTAICFALAGLLWIFAGASIDSGFSTSTSTIADWYTNQNLTFLPVLIGQGLFASAIAVFLVICKCKAVPKATALFTSMVTGITTVVITICSLYSFFETSTTYEMGDMNFAAWLVVIAGIIGCVCAVFNYLQSKK